MLFGGWVALNEVVDQLTNFVEVQSSAEFLQVSYASSVCHPPFVQTEAGVFCFEEHKRNTRELLALKSPLLDLNPF